MSSNGAWQYLMKGNTMRTLQKRTVFYVQQNQDGNWVDVYCLDSQAEARKWIAENKILDTQILEVETATRNPEVVNKRFEQVGKPQEKTDKFDFATLENYIPNEELLGIGDDMDESIYVSDDMKGK